MNVYESLGVKKVINARGYSTKLGGCLMSPQVLEAMREAANSFVRIEDLQEAAGKVIAEITGAEAGYVTSGAAAALTLGMASCMTGLDPVKMNQLPDTAEMKNEVIILRAHRNDYDHALRAAGAQVVEVGFNYATFPYEIERAISELTAAVFFLADVSKGALAFEQVVEIAHRRNVPVIVDAAAALPPVANIHSFIEQGADLVALSGGKHIRGPQASGILCGRRDLIFAAALQHQDMDVFPETWTYRHLIRDEVLAGPPHHGIGRGLKVGKEEIMGLVTALKLYVKRDFKGELEGWKSKIETIVDGLKGIQALQAQMIFPQKNGQAVPSAHIRVDVAESGMDAHSVVNALQEAEPMICTYESLASDGIIVIFPESLQEGDPETIVRRFQEILTR